MSRFVRLALLSMVLTVPAHAQLSHMLRSMETTIAYGPRWSHSSRRDNLDATPAAFRTAFVRNETPWGAEFGGDIGGLRESSNGRLKEIIVSAAVTRRLTPRSKAGTTAGLYALVGLTKALLAPNTDARVASLYGYKVGLSQRVALGKVGILRADVAYARDNGRDFEGRNYPGSEGMTTRLGIGIRDMY